MRGSNYHNLEYRKSSKGFLFKVPTRPGDNMGANTTLDHGAINPPKSTPAVCMISKEIKSGEALKIEAGKEEKKSTTTKIRSKCGTII